MGVGVEADRGADVGAGEGTGSGEVGKERGGRGSVSSSSRLSEPLETRASTSLADVFRSPSTRSMRV